MPVQSESSSGSCAEPGGAAEMDIEIAVPLSSNIERKTSRVTPKTVSSTDITPTNVNAADVTITGGINRMSEGLSETRRVSRGGSCNLDASREEVCLETEPTSSAFVENSVGEMEYGTAPVENAATMRKGLSRGSCTVMSPKSTITVTGTPGLANCSSVGPNGQSSAVTPTAIEGASASAPGGAAVGVTITRTTTACGSFSRFSPLPGEEPAESFCLKSAMVKKYEDAFQQQPEEASSVGQCCGSDAVAAFSRSSTASGRAATLATSAAFQSTPFQLNRYILLLLHVLYVFASARVLFGWPNLSNMLFRSDAFAWLCSDADVRPGNARYLCQAQDNAVQLLFTVGIATSFCCSLLAGIVMDWRGPRFCAVVGQILNTAGWIFLGLANQNCQTYIGGVLCLALGADAGYLPSLTVSNLFPGHEGLVVVVMSAAMSASFSIPTLMDISWKNHPETLSFRTICFLYAGLGTGVCALIAVLLFPRKPYVSQEELTVATPQTEESQRETGTQTGKSGKIKPQEGRRDSERLISHTEECKHGASRSFVDESGMCYSSSTSAAWSRDALLPGRDEERGAEKENGQVESRERHEKEEKAGDVVSETKDRYSISVDREEKDEQTPHSRIVSSSVPFRRQLRSSYFICFFIYWPLNALFYNFYMTSAENMFNRDVNDLLGILGPLSMIPSVLLGKLADAYGVMSLVLFISSSAVAMYFFALFPFVWTYYVSAVFSCLYVSNFSGQMYAYMRDTFHTSNFGRVVGITSAAGGLLALLRIPLHDSFTLVVLKGNYRIVCGMMLGVTLFCLLLAVRLFFVKRRKSKAYEPDPCDVKKKTNGKHKEGDTTANDGVRSASKEKASCDV